MKKSIVLFALVAASFSAFAQSTTSTAASGTGSTATADSNSVSGATNQGNNQNITFTSPQDTKADVHYSYGSQTIRNTPSVSGPPLTSSNDTCMGSASGSANAPGIGLSFGKTYTDDNCVMLKNSRELWNMGMKAASMALMCNDKNNREALEMTGYTCPQTERRKAAEKANEPTDPIVRKRLGLPALAE